MSAYTTIIGNITADPELRVTGSGISVVNFAVAVNRRRPDSEEVETSFFDCVAWRDLAQHLKDSVQKGDRVIVHGRLEQRKFTDKDNNPRSKIEITADDVAVSLRWNPLSVRRAERVSASDSPAELL